MSVLTLRCPRCGMAFASQIQVDPVSFEGITMERMMEKCCHCGNVSRFERRDYSFDRQPDERRTGTS